MKLMFDVRRERHSGIYQKDKNIWVRKIMGGGMRRD